MDAVLSLGIAVDEERVGDVKGRFALRFVDPTRAGSAKMVLGGWLKITNGALVA